MAKFRHLKQVNNPTVKRYGMATKTFKIRDLNRGESQYRLKINIIKK